MLHALTAAFIVILAYGCVYALCGWLESRLVHHYMPLAADPSLRGTGRVFIRSALRGAVVCALLGMVMVSALAARALAVTLPWYLGLAVEVAVFALNCMFVLVVAWIAFRLECEFTLISPEMLVAVAMLGYAVAIPLYQIAFPR